MSNATAMLNGRARGQAEFALVLKEDPDLAEGLSEMEREAATSLFRAPVVRLSAPRWEAPRERAQKSFGLLILDGLIGRRVRLGRAVSTELLSCGDIVRPGDERVSWETIAPDVEWRVFSDTRLAVLDERLTALIGRRSQLIVNFSARLLRRARAANYLMVVSHLPRVEDRVLATLWHAASSWGRVTPQGVRIPFRLTHEVLGEIVGAHRPSVTVAMRTLQARGKVSRGSDGVYTLTGEPPQWSVPEAEGNNTASAVGPGHRLDKVG